MPQPHAQDTCLALHTSEPLFQLSLSHTWSCVPQSRQYPFLRSPDRVIWCMVSPRLCLEVALFALTAIFAIRAHFCADGELGCGGSLGLVGTDRMHPTPPYAIQKSSACSAQGGSWRVEGN